MGPYTIAVSYASEQRYYVKRFVDYFIKKKIKIYYDRNEQAQMLGTLLHEKLQEIYEKGKIEQASKTYAVGPYTMELLLKKHDEDFYQVRFRYVSTSLYN